MKAFIYLECTHLIDKKKEGIKRENINADINF